MNTVGGMRNVESKDVMVELRVVLVAPYETVDYWRSYQEYRRVI